ncbi:MAG: MotA/TolQ/ExbB proton channel family protein [Kiritimatiellales bacterium]|nr:MotA/TolQ/ExbB proton channel family protein [Kiritimatiellales bacterium]
MDIFNSMLFSFPVADVGFAFRESTLPGQVIVLVLFLSSAWAWTIMLTKYWQLRRAGEATYSFLASFRKERNPTALFTKRHHFPGTPLSDIYEAGCLALGNEMQTHGIDREDLFMGELASASHRQLSPNQLETLRTAVDRTVADKALMLEDQMGLLATAVSASPFLGLLGTVWGVMDAFGGMAVSGSATLSAVAPGISGALLTTVVGLLVALPSAIGYNLLTNKIRRIAVQMDNFAQEFISTTQNIFVVES